MIRLIDYPCFRAFTLGALLVGAAALHGCEEAKTENSPETTTYCLSKVLKADMKLAKAAEMELQDELQLNGRVTFNESSVVKVYPLADGKVENLKVQLGDFVTQGEVLGLMRSTAVADFNNQLITSESNVEIASKNLDVTEDMFRNGLASEREITTSRKELEKAKGDLNRITQVLKIYNVDRAKATYSVMAPISGFIVEQNVTNGTQLRSDNNVQMFTISDLNKVWVIANVYESDIARIRVGLEVSITTLAYPDKVWKGHVSEIFNVLDPESKVMKVRIVLDNHDYLLKPEMFAAVQLDAGTHSRYVVIPTSSLVFNNSRSYVLVYKTDCDIETREVQVLKNVNGNCYLTGGLHAGETVISQNQLLIYNAINQ